MNIDYQTFILKKIEILEELRNVKYNDQKDLVYRMQLTINELIVVLDLEYIPTKRKGRSLKPNIYQTSDINDALKNILPDNVKICVIID